MYVVLSCQHLLVLKMYSDVLIPWLA